MVVGWTTPPLAAPHLAAPPLHRDTRHECTSTVVTVMMVKGGLSLVIVLLRTGECGVMVMVPMVIVVMEVMVLVLVILSEEGQ